MVRLVPESHSKPDDFSDATHHKDVADSLSNLVSQCTGQLSLLVTGAWGAGKTTFIERWATQANKASKHIAIIDAWELSLSTDPFGALVSSIVEALEEISGIDPDIVNKFRDTARSVAMQLVRHGVLMATVGAIDIEKLLTQKDGEQDFVEQRANLKRLKESLKEVAEQVLNKVERPLVIVVDEIDRCSPGYAVSLITMIHRLFSVPGVIFILVADSKQLQAMIKREYGDDYHADKFLYKYVDLMLRFPTAPEARGGEEWYASRISDLIERHDMAIPREYQDILADIAWHVQATLRDLERIIVRLAILEAIAPHTSKGTCLRRGYYSIAIMLACLRILKPSLYQQVYEVAHGSRDPSSTWQDVAEKLGLDRLGNPYWSVVLAECLGVPDGNEELKEARRRGEWDPTRRLTDEESLLGAPSSTGGPRILRETLRLMEQVTA